jgi:hypothetical protein
MRECVEEGSVEKSRAWRVRGCVDEEIVKRMREREIEKREKLFMARESPGCKTIISSFRLTCHASEQSQTGNQRGERVLVARDERC